MLIHLDDSSFSALSRLEIFAHSIGQQSHMSMKSLTDWDVRVLGWRWSGSGGLIA